MRRIVFVLSCTLFEDFYDKHGINLRTYLTKYKDEWSFFYAKNLLKQGLRPIFYFITCKYDSGVYIHREGVIIRFIKCINLFRYYRFVRLQLAKLLKVKNSIMKPLAIIKLQILAFFKKL